jgi:hypothetical protein
MKNMRNWTAGRCRNLGGYENLHIHVALFSVRELATKHSNISWKPHLRHVAVAAWLARQTWVGVTVTTLGCN